MGVFNTLVVELLIEMLVIVYLTTKVFCCRRYNAEEDAHAGIVASLRYPLYSDELRENAVLM